VNTNTCFLPAAKSASAKAAATLVYEVTPLIVYLFTRSKAEYKQPFYIATPGLPHDLKNY